MSLNLQNCYCDYESAEKRAAELTKKTGVYHGVWANALGYWEATTAEGDEVKRERNKRRLSEKH